MTTIAITILTFVITFPIGVLSMIYGWGVAPENWIVIISLAFIQTLIVVISQQIKDSL